MQLTESSANESVIVVGGGIVGIACAHYLRQEGLEVTVLDRGKIAGECSHANCGYICPSHVPPLTEPGAFSVALKSLFNPNSPFRVKPSLDPALFNWMFQFARRCTHRQVLAAGKHLQSILDASIDEYRQLIPENNLDCEWKQDGLLYVFEHADAMDAFAKMDRMLTENFGVAAKRIEGSKLPEFDEGLKTGLAGAFHYPFDASVRPDRLNSQWTDCLDQQGVTFVEGCHVTGVVSGTGRVETLKTSEGDFRADHFVFAMGAWTAKWQETLRCRIPIQPGKGYSVTMERPDQSPYHPMLFPEHKVGVSPFDDGFRLGSMMEFTGYDKTIPPHRIAQLRDAARPYLRASVDGPALEEWYGWRPMTWDSLPIIGKTPELSNAFLATGHNMLGLSLAPSTGRLISELITEQPTHIAVEPYSPKRF